MRTSLRSRSRRFHRIQVDPTPDVTENNAPKGNWVTLYNIDDSSRPPSYTGISCQKKAAEVVLARFIENSTIPEKTALEMMTTNSASFEKSSAWERDKMARMASATTAGGSSRRENC